MKLLRCAVCAVALWSAFCVNVVAKDKSPAVAPEEPCNFLCGLQSYFSSDHMMAAAPEPEPGQAQKTKPHAKKPKAVANHSVPLVAKALAAASSTPKAPLASAPKTTATAKAAAIAPKPKQQAAAETAAAPIVRRRKVASAQRSASWVQPLIPGSAPTITPDFAPAR